MKAGYTRNVELKLLNSWDQCDEFRCVKVANHVTLAAIEKAISKLNKNKKP